MPFDQVRRAVQRRETIDEGNHTEEQQQRSGHRNLQLQPLQAPEQATSSAQVQELRPQRLIEQHAAFRCRRPSVQQGMEENRHGVRHHRSHHRYTPYEVPVSQTVERVAGHENRGAQAFQERREFFNTSLQSWTSRERAQEYHGVRRAQSLLEMQENPSVAHRYEALENRRPQPRAQEQQQNLFVREQAASRIDRAYAEEKRVPVPENVRPQWPQQPRTMRQSWALRQSQQSGPRYAPYQVLLREVDAESRRAHDSWGESSLRSAPRLQPPLQPLQALEQRSTPRLALQPPLQPLQAPELNTSLRPGYLWDENVRLQRPQQQSFRRPHQRQLRENHSWERGPHRPQPLLPLREQWEFNSQSREPARPHPLRSQSQPYQVNDSEYRMAGVSQEPPGNFSGERSSPELQPTRAPDRNTSLSRGSECLAVRARETFWSQRPHQQRLVMQQDGVRPQQRDRDRYREQGPHRAQTSSQPLLQEQLESEEPVRADQRAQDEFNVQPRREELVRHPPCQDTRSQQQLVIQRQPQPPDQPQLQQLPENVPDQHQARPQQQQHQQEQVVAVLELVMAESKARVNAHVEPGATPDEEFLVRYIKTAWAELSKFGFQLPATPAEVNQENILRAAAAFDARVDEMNDSRIGGVLPGDDKRVDRLAYNSLTQDYGLPNSVGPLPGVAVGDEFIYRTKLVLMGLHTQLENGIAIIKLGTRPRAAAIATSVVHSLDSRYTGDDMQHINEGNGELEMVFEGHVAGLNPNDAKSTSGNRAMVNSFLWNVSRVMITRSFHTRGACFVNGERHDDREPARVRVFDGDGAQRFVYSGVFQVQRFVYKRRIERENSRLSKQEAKKRRKPITFVLTRT